MSLRLFRITEFAQSLLTPSAQRRAMHPASLLLLASVWLAVLGNLPLYRALLHLSTSGGTRAWLVLSFALLAIALLGIMLSLLNWQPLLRPVIIALLWFSALNSLLLWTGSTHLKLIAPAAYWSPLLKHLLQLPWWQPVLVLGVLALVPTLWLWPRRLQRLVLMQRLPQNIVLILLFLGLLLLVFLSGRTSLLPMLQEQPQWLDLFSPFNTLLSLRAVAG